MPNPMMGSLYKSADMEEDILITWEPMDGFRHIRAHFGVVFMPNPMMMSLYKSADMEEDLPITWEPMDGFRHMRAHFVVVFHTQSNDEVTVQIS